MTGLHGESDSAPQKLEQEDERLSARRARYGFGLFAVYLILYGGFVLLSAFAPRVMEATLGGVNLGVLYGLLLIGAAFALALVYEWLCRMVAVRNRSDEEGGA